MTASVGCSIVGSGRSSTRTSPGACRTVPRMMGPLPGRWISGRAARRLPGGGYGCASVAPEDLLGHGHRAHRLRPARVERQVGDRLDQLLLGRAVVLRELPVEGELLGVPAGGQRGDRDEAAFLRRQLRALPRLTEEHVVGEVHQRGGEVAEHALGARGLGALGVLDVVCHRNSCQLRMMRVGSTSLPVSAGRSSKPDAAAGTATAAAIIRLVPTPAKDPAREASSAPKTATASAPPTCRLVLKPPLATPARCPGTALSSIAVPGGMTSGPARPTSTISRASAQTGVRAGASPSRVRPVVIAISPAVMSGR